MMAGTRIDAVLPHPVAQPQSLVRFRHGMYRKIQRPVSVIYLACVHDCLPSAEARLG
jgi:hypothetical protein